MNNSVGVRTRDVALAYLLLRATIGLNIFVHGASRILARVSSFANPLVPMFQKTPLPAWSAHWFGLALPWVETILGLLVLPGAAYALRFDRRIGPHIRSYVRLNYAPGLGKRGLQLIYASIYAALLAFRDKNVYSLDALLRGDDDEKQR